MINHPLFHLTRSTGMNEKHVKKITQRLVDDLGKGGIPPWRKPFSSKMPMNLETKHVFTGPTLSSFIPW